MRTVLPTSKDHDKVAAIRREMPAVQKWVFLNTGSNGPLPSCAHMAMLQQAQIELVEGRVGMASYMRMAEVHQEAIACIANILGCKPEEVALTHNTTEGMNIGLFGLNWQPGDEIVTAGSEHEGGLNPIAVIRERFGVKVRFTDIGLQGVDTLAELEKTLTPRTKAVMLSHVSWASGLVLPMREISDMAHAVGALVICDAAQGAGQVPSKVYDMGVDVYALSGQKWLCGPDGTGAVFVREDRMDQILQTYVGYGAVTPRQAREGVEFTPRPGALRYQAISHSTPAIRAFATGMSWIDCDLGWEWVYQRIRELGRYCYDTLAALPGVQMYMPSYDGLAGLIHFTVDGIAPADLTEKLGQRGISIRHTPDPVLNRASTGFYNTEEDIDRLAEAITELQVS